jgi:aspartate-semialdehyde dehydrogenase
LDKLKIAIVGATGVIGQQFVVALQDHPWFEISTLAASKKSAGKKYLEAIKNPETGAVRWFCDNQPKQDLLEMNVEDATKLNLGDIDVIFSAVESKVARELEPKYAKRKPVVSTASAFRYEKDVPILVPGVNSEHVKMIDVQRKKRGWKGFITTQPNCTTTGLVITLKPLKDIFSLKKVIMTSMQAISGGGRSPGVAALDIIENVIPYIPEEEEKVQLETKKILGKYVGNKIEASKIKVSCTCTRVNVIDGHTEAVFASMGRDCTIEEVKKAFEKFGDDLKSLKLPSAPEKMIVVKDNPFRPQPRLDRNTYDGMATTVGRIRKDEALINGIKYVLLSHNTKMGAAKGAVFVTEYLKKAGYV